MLHLSHHRHSRGDVCRLFSGTGRRNTGQFLSHSLYSCSLRLDGHAALCRHGCFLLFRADYGKPSLADGCRLFGSDRLPDGVPCPLDRISLGSSDLGAYWVWDARLTSALILFFFYLGYIALQNAIPDWRRADKACAVIGIVGVINVPIVYFSVQWWNTLHQGASITASGSSIHPVMLWALALMVIGFWLYTFAVTFVRLRSVILERERNQEWAQQLALKGEL